MPKKKVLVEAPVQGRSRRAASKEALKQMQILLDDEDDDEIEPPVEIPSDDDIEIQPPPKKKYKVSHRKSSDGHDRDVIVLKSITNTAAVVAAAPPAPLISAPALAALPQHKKDLDAENTLELESWIEELSDVQKQLKKKYDDENKELQSKVDAILKAVNSSTIHKSDISAAYEIESAPPVAPPTNYVLQSTATSQTGGGASSYQLVMDSRLGLVIGPVATSSNPPPLTATSAPKGTILKPKVQIAQAVKDVANATARETDTRLTRIRGKNAVSIMPPLARTGKLQPVKPSLKTTAVKTSITQLTRIGGAPVAKQPLVLPKNATPVTRQRTPIGTRTTFTVSNSRPTESTVEGGLAAGGTGRGNLEMMERGGQADSREISFNKLQGKTFPSLVVVARPHMRVIDLNVDRPKLDTKVKSVLMHPPTKFTEWLIQQGLVRSEQTCSIHPSSQLKLGMYSDVSKFPYSGGYVWISECCPQRFVSVFSGSLFEGSPHPPVVILKLLYHWACQTNIQNVTQWVKVDNLYVKGLYTWLRAVCTVAIHTHIKQLGGAGSKVEVGVISLGTTSQDGNQRQVKVEVLGILETTTKFVRLRAVEPDGDRNYKKRFSKILEPVMHWVHPSSIIVTDLTVDKSTLHAMGFMNVVQSTSNAYDNSNRTIMEYLRQVVPRMFQNTLSLLSRQIIQQFLDELVWREWFGTTASQAFDNLVTHVSEQTRLDGNNVSSLIMRLNRVAANPFKGWALANNTQLSTNNTVKNDTPRRYNRTVRKTPTPAAPPPQLTETPARPAKSTSPDVPEQMVPLENYYYGTFSAEKKSRTEIPVVFNMKCPFCKIILTDNISLMSHLFKHAHNASGEAQLCRYCLTSVPLNASLEHHVNTSHPSETKFDNGFVCLICETQFMNPFILGKHMSREHCPYEMPYQCGSCSYRCSNHKQAIDHFYSTHSNGPSIQCPFCLRSVMMVSKERVMYQNIHYFIQHLQKHQKKQIAKRCGRCNLWFITKELLKDHQSKMHASQRGKVGLIPGTAPRNYVMVPKSNTDKVPDDELINYSTLHYNITKSNICKECDKSMNTTKHFSSFESCTNTNCQYSTCCSNAMKTHTLNCKTLQSTIPEEPLPYEMFCICGFNANDGNILAKHLAICERKSAYPSRSAANKATIKLSMLDVLGLVRKPEESQTSEVANKDKPNVQEQSETGAPSGSEEATKSDDSVMEVDEQCVQKRGEDEVSRETPDVLGGPAGDVPSENVPEESTEDIPEENVEDVLGETAEDVCGVTVEDFPEEATGDVPGENVDDVPEETVDDVPEKTDDDVTGGSIEESVEDVLGDDVGASKEQNSQDNPASVSSSVAEDESLIGETEAMESTQVCDESASSKIDETDSIIVETETNEQDNNDVSLVQTDDSIVNSSLIKIKPAPLFDEIERDLIEDEDDKPEKSDDFATNPPPIGDKTEVGDSRLSPINESDDAKSSSNEERLLDAPVEDKQEVCDENVVSQSVLDALAAECANTASLMDETGAETDFDSVVENNICESENVEDATTPMETE